MMWRRALVETDETSGWTTERPRERERERNIERGRSRFSLVQGPRAFSALWEAGKYSVCWVGVSKIRTSVFSLSLSLLFSPSLSLSRWSKLLSVGCVRSKREKEREMPDGEGEEQGMLSVFEMIWPICASFSHPSSLSLATRIPSPLTRRHIRERHDTYANHRIPPQPRLASRSLSLSQSRQRTDARIHGLWEAAGEKVRERGRIGQPLLNATFRGKLREPSKEGGYEIRVTDSHIHFPLLLFLHFAIIFKFDKYFLFFRRFYRRGYKLVGNCKMGLRKVSGDSMRFAIIFKFE